MQEGTFYGPDPNQCRQVKTRKKQKIKQKQKQKSKEINKT